MPPQDRQAEAQAQPLRGHDALEAEDVIVDVSAYPPELLLKGAQADLAWALAELERKPKPKRTRKPSLTTRVKAAISAGREAVIKPDGTILTREKLEAEGEQANGATVNTWDEALSHEEENR